ncbi:Cys/Met metabolism PLP-dependent enzyme-domain-containing protein [Diplogelasinospora grovesii]|uniref:Cys/Met metabolism PLP-dependent enzyme-domain-containing protein n=1 Tax=Diplogelasinospora grovesii TaxID=303347 RepID=A0AAN6RZT8_9PEZI|nr:Cys/Met metabolism PLP-dependent enzyme-domain-containing protein [Diplogelasinospora grovesii]
MADAFAPYKVNANPSNHLFNTLQVHAGHKPDSQTLSRAVPIYATASYVFQDADHARRVCTNEEAGYVYSRIANPTVEVFEKRCAALEGGTAAVATSSGQAAVFQTIVLLAQAGDNIIASRNLYGGSYSCLKTLLPRLGIEVRWLDVGDRPDNVASLIDERTKLVFVETIGNPRCSVPDVRGMADKAHEAGVPLVVDNTFGACGYFCRAKDHGADVVVHSATKWIGGHGTTVGGVVVDSGTFDWAAHPKRFPHIAAAGDELMGFSYAKLFGNAFAMALRIDVVMEVGGVLNPFAAQQLILGLETLSLRCERIARNSMQLAQFLESHENRLGSVPCNTRDHEWAEKLLKNGYGGVLSIGVVGGNKASKHVINNFRLVSNMTNVGDSKTMATHPWSSTHVIMSEADRIAAGVTEDLIRISIGTEAIEDIIEDFDNALKSIPVEDVGDGIKEQEKTASDSGFESSNSGA